MKGYIEDEAWVSCTFDMSGTPRQLKKVVVRNVGYAPNTLDKDLLVIDDKQILTQFKCLRPAKQWGGLLALVGGMVVGVALVLSGPVGWIALGALAVVAIGTAITIACHDCTDALKSGNWQDYSTTVTIYGKPALFYNKSTLVCGNSGILLASGTFEDAKKLSDDMKWSARGELGVQILSEATIGVITGYGAIDKGGADLDLSTIPLGIMSYVENDFIYPDRSPEMATIHGLKYTAAGYGLGYADRIPGAPSWTGHLGTEFSGEDLLVSALTTGIGYGADKLEEYLADGRDETIDKRKIESDSGNDKSIVAEK